MNRPFVNRWWADPKFKYQNPRKNLIFTKYFKVFNRVCVLVGISVWCACVGTMEYIQIRVVDHSSVSI